MEKKTKYYVVREKAVPEVLLKVVEAKRILDSERATTVQVRIWKKYRRFRNSCYRGIIVSCYIKKLKKTATFLQAELYRK